MSVLSSAHVHTEFCHGEPAAKMCETAYAKGFVSIGFTSHSPMPYTSIYNHRNPVPDPWDESYKKELNRLKALWEGKLKIYIGVERDYYSKLDPSGFDYFIGSVHDLETADGDHIPVDSEADALKKYLEQECNGDGMELARRYFALITAYQQEWHPPITGHFDLIRKNNPILHFVDEESTAYQKLALDTLDTLRGSGTLLEINTGGIARRYLPTPYPAPFLLKAWKEFGGEVIINSDCHEAQYLDCYFSESEDLLRSLGYDHAVRLGAGQEMWERYKL